MKKLSLLLLPLLFTLSLTGQKMDFWLDAGAKIQYGGSMLFNSAIGDDNNWDYAITTTTKVGGKIGMNWNYTGISLDVMVGQAKGVFQNTTPGGGGPDREVSMSTVDLYLLFRDARNRGYIELGPKMSFVGDVRSGNSGEQSIIVDESYFETMPLSAVLGFGTYVLGNDGRFSGIFGLRFEYGFSDVVTDAGRSATDRQPVNYIGDGQSTHPIFAGVVFELNWGIGGVGQARCGEKSKFIWF